MLTPGLEHRAAGMSAAGSKIPKSLLGHIPFPGKVSQGSTRTIVKPVMKLLNLKSIGHIIALLLYQGHNLRPPRVIRQWRIENLKQACVCLAWSKTIHLLELPRGVNGKEIGNIME